MLQETRELLLAKGLSDTVLRRLEKFSDDVIRRNLVLAEERQPNNFAGFIIAACERGFAEAPTPRVAPTPLPTTSADRKQLEKKLRAFKLERELILATPRVLAERFGGEWRLTQDEQHRLKVLETAISELEQALGGDRRAHSNNSDVN